MLLCDKNRNEKKLLPHGFVIRGKCRKKLILHVWKPIVIRMYIHR